MVNTIGLSFWFYHEVGQEYFIAEQHLSILPIF